MLKIYREILAQIVPTKAEEKTVHSEIDCFLKKLNSMLKRPRAILGGSMAKGTWLRGIYDVDIFVQFPYATESEKLSDLLE
ncbi:MAG: nucleotidyltransferase domain-containing protein, partial [Candidatus Woesearchaeota archaeon]